MCPFLDKVGGGKGYHLCPQGDSKTLEKLPNKQEKVCIQIFH